MSTEKLKMLRSVLDRQQLGLGETPESSSTPLRGGNVAYPRIRLMDKHTKLAEIPVYTLSSSKPAPGVPNAVRDKAKATRPDKWLPPRVQQRWACQADRFIPQRRHQNFAVSNYLLTKVPPRVERQTEIDVFGQLLELDATWRKRLMKSAMEKTNILPGASQQRVLNIGKPVGASRENYRGAESSIDDSSTDGVWKVRARDKPLVGLTEITAGVPTMRHNWGRGLLDWGATNFIAAMIGNAVVTFDGPSKMKMSNPVRLLDDITSRTRAIKWNTAGTRIAICTAASMIMVYDLVSGKTAWCRLCRCTTEEPTIACEVLCVAWTHTDTELVIGCSEGRLSWYKASVGTVIDTIFAHEDMIISVTFSPTDRYLVTTGMDKAVRVITWPYVLPDVTIGYYEPVQAVAWHPWEVDKLCVGGGFEDASLSLWDVHRNKSLGFRKVPFVGVVKNMTWNKLSGELVVQWNYEANGKVRAVVPVLSSLDRVVDCVGTASRIMDIVWNPEGTQLALRTKDTVKIENFFGNETAHWYNVNDGDKLSRSKKKLSAGRTTNFESYNIR